MAKLTARGAHKVVGYVFDVTSDDQKARGERMETAYVLRSDGAVLSKTDSVYPASKYDGGRSYRNAGSYSIRGYVRDHKTSTPDDKRARFQRFIDGQARKLGTPRMQRY